jgi:hypothetical protein
MPTRSIYLDDKTDQLAEEVLKTTGVKLSLLFKEFLELKKSSLGMQSQMALIQDCSTLALGNEDDPYTFERWMDATKVKRVLLVGITLRDVLANHESLWNQVVKLGGKIQVLRQGQLENSDAPVTKVLARMRLDDGTSLTRRQREAERILKNLYIESEKSTGTVEIRNSDDRLLTYSAILVWMLDPPGDIFVQIHPYVASYDLSPGPRFIVKTNENSPSFSAIIRPIVDLWGQSKFVQLL